ncbi:hypothetical protein G6F57_010149 [Rhizopus arrhizus]|nr:hypothetical protein G6F39_010647 [Rhizopus arrhizus]KAG1181575.1 hypothetical protein G6F36_009790 [Rhizopus arrhizus]KAG1333854.1 hypothetical protein G6F63_010061 [Rhizopus arrhizus]KAG1414435.1 hypothetical protein G6F59_010265 [Rhizopus arrhizus]KAG1475025.1 hypothetical protein G6F57_010149 [Rhizopus arrhizus]
MTAILNLHHYDEPTSPTFSNFLSEKTPSEIKNVLKSTFRSLQERERDLRLAASVGKTLLEDNKLLEDQTKLLLEHKDSRTEDKQQQQIIDSLKQEHQELLNQYHSITTTNKQMKAEDDHAKLKVQLDTLYEKLENTYSIIERYDDERRIHLEQIRLQRKYEAEKKSSNKITNLSVKVDCISIENHALLEEKEKIENRLRSAMQELKATRDRVFALRELQEQCNTLNEKYHHQTLHVNQLELWIKECQNEPVNLFPKFSHEIIQGSSLFSEQQLYNNEGLDNQAYDGIDSYLCAISVVLGLKLEKTLIIAALRCLIQLTIMGFILEDVFKTKRPELVMLMACVLILLGAYETVYNKSKQTYKGMFISVLLSSGISTLVIGIIGSRWAMNQKTFWLPEVFIPTMGMLLGNTMSGMAVALSSCLSSVSHQKEQIETHLAFGASRWEAGQSIAIEAVRLSMLPTINQMSVIGLISIPGMMTGQILGGAPVSNAVKYQQIIMFLISASTALGVLSAVISIDRFTSQT